jgi:hypothetical protein
MIYPRSTGARDLAFTYRQRASEQVMISSEKARQVWLAADELDQLAREYRRQVPRGQMS